MEYYEKQKGDYLISTDRDRLDITAVHKYLSKSSYWAQGRTRHTVATSIDHSLCFGVYYTVDSRQVGFARAVTDQASFAWLCDLFILEPHRGKGLGKWLVETIISHLQVRNVKRIILATSDAHTLYGKYGKFGRLQYPERWMERLADNI